MVDPGGEARWGQITNTRPVPEPDGLTQFYWEGTKAGRLLIQRCDSCGWFLHPPDVVCPRCLSQSLVPTPVRGQGVIYAFTVARQAFDRAFIDHVPYVLALVDLEEQPNLRMLTNIVDTPLDQVSSGLPVELTFEQCQDYRLPQFRVKGQQR